jgi:hypothetical protein
VTGIDLSGNLNTSRRAIIIWSAKWIHLAHNKGQMEDLVMTFRSNKR